MTPALFLDTSGWLSAMLPDQTGHVHARDTYRAAVTARKGVITTNLVVAEMHSLLLRYRGVSHALRFYDDAARDALHEIVYVDEELERAAVEAWTRPRGDQGFSLCDAVSFEVMRRGHVRTALTFDKHFAAAGFQILK